MAVPDVPSPDALIARKTDTQPAVVLRTVCAWHTSPLEFAELHRQFPGQISHGLCAECRRRLEEVVA